MSKGARIAHIKEALTYCKGVSIGFVGDVLLSYVSTVTSMRIFLWIGFLFCVTTWILWTAIFLTRKARKQGQAKEQ